MALAYIVYVSTSVHLLSKEELDAILEVSRKNNTALDITGILLYFEGSLTQVLEGEEEVIERLYAKIECDPRHKNILRVMSGPLERRNCSGWAMGHQSLSAGESREMDGLLDLRRYPLTDYVSVNDHPSMLFIKEMYNINR